MNFGDITFEKGIRNFGRLDLPVEHLTCVAKEYSRLWNVNEMIGVQHLFRYKENYRRKRLRKKSLKNILAGFKTLIGASKN
jgi:hypothetical protein